MSKLVKPQKKYSVAIKFVKEDVWIGVFWEKKPSRLDIYVCLLPCFPIHCVAITLKKV